MDIPTYSVHQVMYYDNVSGVPQIGHFVVNDVNEADQTFFTNAETQAMLAIADLPSHVMTFHGFSGWMGRIPKILAN